MKGRKEKRPRRGHDSEHGTTGPGCKGIGRKAFKYGQPADWIGKADGFVLGCPER